MKVKLIYFRLIRYFVTSCFLFLAVVTAIACTPQRKQVNANIVSALEFLQDGKTEKREIIIRFGKSYFSYENGKIIIYDYYLESDLCDLVLVFRQDNVLERHSLVCPK